MAKKYKYGLKIKSRKGGTVHVKWNDPSSEFMQKIFESLYSNTTKKR